MTPPAPPSIDILALGNAIVDVLSHVDDAVVDALPVNKGGMTLIGAVEAKELYGVLGPGIECSGGSAANTVVGAAMLGARTAFVGRVRDDQLSQVFTDDIRAAGFLAGWTYRRGWQKCGCMGAMMTTDHLARGGAARGRSPGPDRPAGPRAAPPRSVWSRAGTSLPPAQTPGSASRVDRAFLLPPAGVMRPRPAPSVSNGQAGAPD